MQKVQYYLDETDQIEVDGHTLSRLYLAPDVAYPSDSILSRYAVYGEDNTNKYMVKITLTNGWVDTLKV